MKGKQGLMPDASDKMLLQPKDVEAGLMNDDQVQITSGLSQSDSVIVAPDKSISDGTRVKPIGKAIQSLP